MQRLRTHLPYLLHQTLTITLGAFLTAVAINLFLVPHQLVTGGVGGLALFVAYLIKLPVWMLVLGFNLPIFIAGFLLLGRSFLAGSLFGMVMMTVFIYLTEGMSQVHLVQDPFMSSIFGGVLGGVGMGLTLRVNGSLGGTDIIGAICKKYFSISIGTMNFVANALIVVLTGTIFGSDIASLALINIFVESIALDKTIQGLDTSKGIFIMTEKPSEIAALIMEKLNRGVTLLQGEGGFTQSPRQVIYTVVSLRQLARVKYYVQTTDPKAFMSIADVAEVVGEGFRPSPF
ncbi:MAG: YitT family protein [Deltaproteobacteria bacterium]|nr:YitT family protein [Deltaproteobacteria bacterium]